MFVSVQISVYGTVTPVTHKYLPFTYFYKPDNNLSRSKIIADV